MSTDPDGLRISFGGLASGLDTNALVRALIDVERVPVRRLESRRDDVEDQQRRFRELNSLLDKLRSASAALDNQTDQLAGPSLDEEFLAFTGTSSDESILTVSADGQGSASVGSFDVRVDRLASAARRVSAAYTDAGDTVGQAGDTLRIDYGGSAPIDITLAAGTTLQALRDAINGDANNDGSVRAELLDDGSGGVRMILAGSETGVEHDLSVTTTITAAGGGSFIDAALGQDAQDAELRVFGVTIYRGSNDIDDAIPGMTLHLAGTHDPASPTAQAVLTVERDDDAMAADLQAFVDAYNAVRSFMQQQTVVNPETNRAGPLSGDPTLRTIERLIRDAAGQIVSFDGNPFSSLSDVGVRFDDEGRLTLERDVLTDALESDPLRVRELLSGYGGGDGIATAMARALDPIIQSGDGTLASKDSSFDDRIAQLADSIERMEARVAKREEGLIARFTQLEQLITTFQSQSLFLNGFGR